MSQGPSQPHAPHFALGARLQALPPVLTLEPAPITASTRPNHAPIRELAIASLNVGVLRTACSTPNTARSARLGCAPPMKGRLGPTASTNSLHALKAGGEGTQGQVSDVLFGCISQVKKQPAFTEAA